MLKCPACQSEEFYVVIERTWSFKVNAVGLSDVIPGLLEDEVAGKSLVCDDCGFNGWIDEYHLLKSGVVTLTQEDEE